MLQASCWDHRLWLQWLRWLAVAVWSHWQLGEFWKWWFAVLELKHQDKRSLQNSLIEEKSFYEGPHSLYHLRTWLLEQGLDRAPKYCLGIFWGTILKTQFSLLETSDTTWQSEAQRINVCTWRVLYWTGVLEVPFFTSSKFYECCF